MAHSSKHKGRVSWKRHTWPRTQVNQLETIPESPRTPQKTKFGFASQPDEGKALTDNVELLDSVQSMRIEEKIVSPNAVQAQMIWYSHHLEESHHDRERLVSKIKELETVCRTHSKSNVTLVQDIQSWQTNYEAVESELIDTTQELEEAKAYVRSVETANANLRYALSQAREEQERARRNSWSNRALRCWQTCTHLSSSVLNGFRRPSIHKRKKRSAKIPVSTARPESMLPIIDPSTSKVHLPPSRACSRTSGCLPEDCLSSSSSHVPVKDNRGAG